MGDVITDGRSGFPRECSASAAQSCMPCDCFACRVWRRQAIARAYAEAAREVKARYIARTAPKGVPDVDG